MRRMDERPGPFDEGFVAGLVADLVRPVQQRVLEVMAAPGPAGGGGSFFVDPERAQECIRGLRGVANYLGQTESLLDGAYFPPPGADAVSVNVAIQAGIMAGRAAGFVAAWRTQLSQTAEGLEQQLAAYRAVEEANRARLT